jgi:hypothetical protein
MKEALENIEHFAKIKSQAMSEKGSSKGSTFGGNFSDQNDRRRILT